MPAAETFRQPEWQVSTQHSSAFRHSRLQAFWQASADSAISACVVGGVSMSGGVGKSWGVVVGTLLITVIANGLDILGVSSHWQKIVKGVIIVAAVLIDVKGKSKKN